MPLKLQAESMIEERGDLRSAAKKVVTAQARRELVRQMVNHGLSERRSLAVVQMVSSEIWRGTLA